ncbi:hypothetical protein [Sphingomonas hankookensis]
MVAPNERSSSILSALPGETVKVNNGIMSEVDATDMATSHLGFELIASTTSMPLPGCGARPAAFARWTRPVGCAVLRLPARRLT